jgi:uncharacterized NAD(P)/FAD-binding protein YdhS
MTPTIAIVGGGISGTLTVLNCVKQSKIPLKIIWFDAKNQFCKGLAYSTSNLHHLLNVRAGNMSIFADEPNHFTDWLTQNHPHYKASDFVPRKLFGEYVNDTFEVLRNSNELVSISKITEEVVDIKTIDDVFELKASNTYKAQKVVLALGNFLPEHPRSISKAFIESENYFQNAFHTKLSEKALTKNDVTIIGSGLTMIDALILLHYNSFSGQIHIISPHAFIPQSHMETNSPSAKPFLEKNKSYGLLELFSLVNKQFKAAKNENLNTQNIIDVMRPHLQSIWLNFSLLEKYQFLSHLRHKWGVARHRAPNQSMDVFNQLINSGTIKLIKGRVFNIETKDKSFEISYKNSESNDLTFKTDLIINCTGPQSNYNEIPSLLVQNLIKNNIIEPDSINYGINASKNGEISPNVYTIGPPLKGILWESTAIPEIRLQAKELASKIICN